MANIENMQMSVYADSRVDEVVRLRNGRYRLSVDYEGLSIVQFGEQIGDSITAIKYRGIANYERFRDIPRGFVDKVVSEGLQLIEVGAGLAELVPAIALRTRIRPIVIDPLDYRAIEILLRQARDEVADEENSLLIERLLGRVAVYRDPSLVNLLNMTLEEACQRYPDLFGIADVVIDVCGANLYSKDPRASYQLERRLLKGSH